MSEHVKTSGSKSPRGTCPECGRDLALRMDGTVRVHRSAAGGWHCPGSERLAVAIQAMLDREACAALGEKP